MYNLKDSSVRKQAARSMKQFFNGKQIMKSLSRLNRNAKALRIEYNRDYLLIAHIPRSFAVIR